MGFEQPMRGRSVPIRTRKIHEQINWEDKNIPSAVSVFQILCCDNKEALGYVCDYNSKTWFDQAVLLLTCQLSGALTSLHHHFMLCADYSSACEGVLKAVGLSWRTRFGPRCLRNRLSSLHHAEGNHANEGTKACCYLLQEESKSCTWAVRDLHLLVLVFPPLPGSSKCCAVSLPWGTDSMPVSGSGLQGA